MKILVFSDSHRNVSHMIDVVNACKTDTSLIVHLGDIVSDYRRLTACFPDIPSICVKGNNDVFEYDCENECLYNFEGVKCFFTHGHLYGVKSGTGAIVAKAKENGANLVLFGHTHIPYYERTEKTVLLNPGSIGYPYQGHLTFAIVQLNDSRIMSADLLSFDPVNKKIDFLR